MPKKLTEIKPNPNNPRNIRDEKFKQLVQSIREFPQMMELRPIVINSDNIVLGGNMRLEAIKELGHKEIPDGWVVKAESLTPEQQREFIIKDNVGFGSWDWDLLANEWDEGDLIEWGLDIPGYAGGEPDYEDLIGESKDKPASMKITFQSVEQLQSAESDIQELLDRKYEGAFYSISAGEI